MKVKGPVREADVLQTLESRPLREMVARCVKQARPVKELSEQAGVPLASAYRQVRALADSGILVIERSAMTSDGKPFDLYRSRIKQARLELKPEAIEVSWEVNASMEDRLASMWGHLAG